MKQEIQELQRARATRKSTYEDPKELLEKILEVIPEVASLTSQFGKYMSVMPNDKKETLQQKLSDYYSMMFMTAKETGIAIQSDKSFANSGTNSHMSPNDVYRNSKLGEEPFNQNELMKL